jgi:cell wall-associated NlpC family hydrolase
VTTKGVVIDSVTNLYSDASRDVELISQSILGTELTILESRDGWYYVEMPDRYRGWIEASHVGLYAPGDTPYASKGQVAQICNLFVFLYHQPRASVRPPTHRITLGTRLEVVEPHDRWLKVALPDGAERWIQNGDVTISAADATATKGSVADVIATAKRFLGLPYLWGGTTPLGIDCSGFVQIAYHLHGASLLRDSSIQFTQPDLEIVDKQDLQAGDLVFFGETRITHVGMYIGDGEFIHATTHLRPIVQISRLDELHWVERYQGARKVSHLLQD